ncbi:MAG: single-stranded-DNA-specific exonuclease RecJ [Myxococcales bacterium]|nr:single-stranded-DNA-specific exonuclease RecJ [Myxococcales bacterium]MCB9531104.1 single-stranded-DNA-specific exonuclease RecJ [Myxococcales bacterium]
MNGLEDMRAMLRPSLESLHDPFSMRNMDKAVRRIRRALLKKERIQIHGDYDVDGITATAVLLLGLRGLGADVGYHIINRRDSSVGLSVLSLERDHLPKQPKLIITADCGTSSNAAIEAAKAQDIDVIVVDHHLPGTFLPTCTALLNPQQPKCEFPFKQLAAVGVAFNLILALQRFLAAEGGDWPALDLVPLMDLVALGTVSDLVALTDENRVFVHEGLRLIRTARRPGICAIMGSAHLISQAGRAGLTDSINARTIGFRLAPLLNAAGRMDDANKCVELLTTDSYRVADAIASELVAANQERQARERLVLEDAETRASNLVDAGAHTVVLASRDWHPGVLGIVASRLVEKFNLPALVAAIDDSGMAKGSVRGPDGVDMLDALRGCRDLLDTYGGHRVAAGVAFPALHAEELQRRLNLQVAGQLPDGARPERILSVDAFVDLAGIEERMVEELEQLAPFGAGNPEPLFEAHGVFPIQPKAVGGRNVRLRLRQGSRTFSAFCFGLAGRLEELKRPIDVVFHPRIVRTGKQVEVELMIRDFTPA